MRVIVCGGRNFQNREFCFEKLDDIIGQFDNVEIISGNAKGADTFGEEYAFTDQGSIVEVFTDLGVWANIKGIIDSINENAAA